MRRFGLIGQKLSHSFSKKYFEEKFRLLNIKNCSYSLFELDTIEKLPELLENHPDLHGLNVTIPYKQSVIPFLTEIDPFAQKIGAVNTLKISQDKIVGFNTDYFGFLTSLTEWFDDRNIRHALILGSGGASNAVKVALSNLDISYTIVSRSRLNGERYLTYQDLNSDIIIKNKLIINTTPLGMYPEIDTYPDIPYQFLSENHFLYDLVYNPETTTFMKKGMEQGAHVKSGLEMLQLQAEKAWDIWNS